MAFLKDLLSGTSEISCMRFMSLVSLFFGVAIAVIGIFLSKDLSSLAVLSGVFVGAAFGGKAIQTVSENKNAQ